MIGVKGVQPAPSKTTQDNSLIPPRQEEELENTKTGKWGGLSGIFRKPEGVKARRREKKQSSSKTAWGRSHSLKQCKEPKHRAPTGIQIPISNPDV